MTMGSLQSSSASDLYTLPPQPHAPLDSQVKLERGGSAGMELSRGGGGGPAGSSASQQGTLQALLSGTHYPSSLTGALTSNPVSMANMSSQLLPPPRGGSYSPLGSSSRGGMPAMPGHHDPTGLPPQVPQHMDASAAAAASYMMYKQEQDPLAPAQSSMTMLPPASYASSPSLLLPGSMAPSLLYGPEPTAPKAVPVVVDTYNYLNGKQDSSELGGGSHHVSSHGHSGEAPGNGVGEPHSGPHHSTATSLTQLGHTTA